MNGSSLASWAACILGGVAVLVFAFYAYKRWYFSRDPARAIHPTASIVAPADGKVLYVEDVVDGVVPISIKKRRELPLDDIVRGCHASTAGVLVGTYLSPFDVHYQRSPIAGVVAAVNYHPAPRNVVMDDMFWRYYLRIWPMHVGSTHIYLNERNVIRIVGEQHEVYVVQIADYYVNRIDCYVKPGEVVEKGQKIGLIHAGSQVDLYVVGATAGQLDGVRPGDTVRAGSSGIRS